MLHASTHFFPGVVALIFPGVVALIIYLQLSHLGSRESIQPSDSCDKTLKKTRSAALWLLEERPPRERRPRRHSTEQLTRFLPTPFSKTEWAVLLANHAASPPGSSNTKVEHGSLLPSVPPEPLYLDTKKNSYELELLSKIRFSKVRARSIQPRFPLLVPIPVVVDAIDPTTIEPENLGAPNGTCIMGSQLCTMLDPSAVVDPSNNIDNRWYAYDPHIRDFVTSILLPCGLQGHLSGGNTYQKRKCVGVDVGSNFGSITLNMLHMGGGFDHIRTFSVEPQPDVCTGMINAIWRSGRARDATVRCGLFGVASDLTWNDAWSGLAYRYDGAVNNPFSFAKYKINRVGVPYVTFQDLLETPPLDGRGADDEDAKPIRVVDLMKIDTDSIDCEIWKKVIFPSLRASKSSSDSESGVDILNFSFESNGCGDLASILHTAQTEFGYTIYRSDATGVIFREFGEAGQPKAGEKDEQKFGGGAIVQQFDVRHNRYLWRFKDGLGLGEWEKLVRGAQWQFFVTKEKWESRWSFT